MRAVWSFWSRPFPAHRSNIWCKPLHHLLAWGLSVQAARRHYPETVLITDRPGKKLLVDQLGLPFAEVSTELERLNDADPAGGLWGNSWLTASRTGHLSTSTTMSFCGSRCRITLSNHRSSLSSPSIGRTRALAGLATSSKRCAECVEATHRMGMGAIAVGIVFQRRELRYPGRIASRVHPLLRTDHHRSYPELQPQAGLVTSAR